MNTHRVIASTYLVRSNPRNVFGDCFVAEFTVGEANLLLAMTFGE